MRPDVSSVFPSYRDVVLPCATFYRFVQLGLWLVKQVGNLAPPPGQHAFPGRYVSALVANHPVDGCSWRVHCAPMGGLMVNTTPERLKFLCLLFVVPSRRPSCPGGELRHAVGGSPSCSLFIYDQCDVLVASRGGQFVSCGGGV
jgi:hypothetical protein